MLVRFPNPLASEEGNLTSILHAMTLLILSVGMTLVSTIPAAGELAKLMANK